MALFSVSCEKGTSLENGSYPVGMDFSSGGEQYNDYDDNPFVDVSDEPVSTFSIDADGGSYANVRRFLNNNELPPKGAVRIEELINYFPFDYPKNSSAHPLTLNGEVAECPWTDGHKLIRIGMRGDELPTPRPASSIVFLIDVSGSMSSENKLPLLQHAFKKLVDQLDANDHVAIVTYSGSAGVVLPATPGDQKESIKAAINDLNAGGSTAGGAGISEAYEIAKNFFKEGGNNRVILGTDGDFNVGVSSQEELIALIEDKRDDGIFLTVCGVGTGNYHGGQMEQIANHGNGTYEYIDSHEQAEKVFVREFNKFFTVAQDVKVQVEFNPEIVKRYRLIGYENRVLENDDFENDSADAGELGADQTVTALYQIEPVEEVNWKIGPVFEIDFRYKKPTETSSNEMHLSIHDEEKTFAEASESLRFSAAVAAYGMLLRESPYAGDATFEKAGEWVTGASFYDPHAYKSEFINLIGKAKALK